MYMHICKNMYFKQIMLQLVFLKTGATLQYLFASEYILCMNKVLFSVIQRRQWHPTPVLLPGKSHVRRSLVGCSPWRCEELDTPERLHFHFSLSCIGAGNGNPLQCSCLENPRDRGAWWASVYGVAQSRTRLKQLSSSSSSTTLVIHKMISAVRD